MYDHIHKATSILLKISSHSTLNFRQSLQQPATNEIARSEQTGGQSVEEADFRRSILI